jgi:hypothetical protein
MAIVGESSQKYNKKGGKIRHDVALTWRFKKMTKAKDKTFVAMWKKTKVFNKVPAFHYTFAGVEVSCCVLSLTLGLLVSNKRSEKSRTS